MAFRRRRENGSARRGRLPEPVLPRVGQCFLLGKHHRHDRLALVGVAIPEHVIAFEPRSPPEAGPVKTPGKAGGLKRGDRSKRFLLFAYGELQQLKLLHLPVFFFLVPYVEPNFPFSYSYRAYKISSRPETRSCYFTNFFKMFRYLNSAFSF